MLTTIIKNKTNSFSRTTLYLLALIIFVFGGQCAPNDDKIDMIPGYPDDLGLKYYAGYLKTSSPLRKLHYVFIQSYKGDQNTLPVTMWMNGGPGCASKIGLIQQLAPYLLPVHGNFSGDEMKPNPFSWINLTNLLFIDGPAGVGYSINNDPSYIYNDKNSAIDFLDAIQNFFTQKFPQYRSELNSFYLAGESYAGKYIPDLAVAIDISNANDTSNKINLKGIIMGNQFIYFKNGALEDSQIEFINDRHFIDPKLYPNWQGACHTDTKSASCQFFYMRYEQLMKNLDFYNIYGPCIKQAQSNSVSQSLFTKLLSKNNSRLTTQNSWPFTQTQFSQCFNDIGINHYFNDNSKQFNALTSTFSICNSSIFQKYQISESGSLLAIESLVGMKNIKIYFYSGDWDDVVPFTDTLKNIAKIKLLQDMPQEAFKINNQHVGFVRTYNKRIKFYIIKGAGHQAVAYKPQPTYRMFQQFLAATN